MSSSPAASVDQRSVLWADISWGHTGAHSALAPFREAVAAVLPPGTVNRVPSTPASQPLLLRVTRRVQRWCGLSVPPAGPHVARDQGVPYYRDTAWAVEQRIATLVERTAPRAVVLEALEEQYFLLSRERPRWSGTKLIALAHQPPAWWRVNRTRPELVAPIDRLVVVSSTLVDFWSQYLPRVRIALVPHGVDADFFSPPPEPRPVPSGDAELRLILSGQWLRDFSTLSQVVAAADALSLPVRFDLVVPVFARNNPDCYRLAMSPRVHWHAGLDDTQLRDLYRRADLLLLPLLDSTANNGLLEGMASGLPSIVTDVGGVRDYVLPSFADLVPPQAAAEIVARIQHYLTHRDQLPTRGLAARRHVEAHLAWAHPARQFAALL